MSTMRKTVIAICCSDLHLSLKAPVARAGEEDWLEAQRRPLVQLGELAKKHDAPILCAGDIFDRWNSPPELINWAIENVPYMYAIPGQHDLPLHNRKFIRKSAYWTLHCLGNAKTGKGMNHLFPDYPYGINGVCVESFPWAVDIIPPDNNDGRLHVALVHQYVWIEGRSYPGAPKEAKLSSNKKALKGWDVVIFGDNHKGFLGSVGDTTVFNCGGLQRRKSDEIDYTPWVGLLYDDGTIEPHLLDCSDDIITETVSRRDPKDDVGLQEFLEELTKLQDTGLDFEEAMKRVLEEKKPSPAVRKLILEAME